MKDMKKPLALVLAAVSLCTLLTACAGGSGSVDGTYTQTIDSKTYFSAQEVKADMPETELRPDKTEAMVAFQRLFPMLDSRIADDVAGASSVAGAADYYTLSLELADGKYKLTKAFNVDLEYVADSVKDMMTSEKPSIRVEFSGAYTADGDVVTLEVPTQILANVSPVAGMADAYTRFGGTFMDVTETAASSDTYPGQFFYYFNTPYFVKSSELTAMTATVDRSANTFTIG